MGYRKGKPRILELEGEQGFAGLVKRYSGDMPPRAVLDELVRVGAVEQRKDSRLQLVTHAYVPQKSAVDKLGILGRDVADLIATIDHNLQHGSADPRFQRKVMYHSFPVAALPAFRKLSAQRAQALLERLDRWLAVHVAASVERAAPIPARCMHRSPMRRRADTTRSTSPFRRSGSTRTPARTMPTRAGPRSC